MPEIPQGLCSKCHEGFMNCKCDTFHPTLKVTVTCHDCFDDDSNNLESELDGPLYFNPNTKTQCQVYICPDCRRSVSVIIG